MRKRERVTEKSSSFSFIYLTPTKSGNHRERVKSSQNS